MLVTVIPQRRKDLGGFEVGRVLPMVGHRMVGPFVFFDHMGPVDLPAGIPRSTDVRPHPHIGLATVTYLFDGAVMHRDNLGSEQEITAGAINWMTAGRGIVHSERRPERLCNSTYVNHGLQLWVALPEAHEEVDASFVHTPADAIPELTVQGSRVRVLVGAAFGQVSPVATLAPTLYLDIQLAAGGVLDLPALADEMAVYTVDGSVHIDGDTVPSRTLVVLEPGKPAQLRADAAVRLVVVGGAPQGHRHIWWNFVSSSKERITQAGERWRAMDAATGMGQVLGETEFIPLPERPTVSVPKG